MVFHRSIGNQEQRLDAIESSLERSAIVVVGFPDRSTKSFLVCELLWRASNEDEVIRGQAAQNVLDRSAANATRGREYSDCVLRHGVVQLPGDRCFAVTEIEEIRVLYIGRAREANILYLTESGSINLQASGPACEVELSKVTSASSARFFTVNAEQPEVTCFLSLRT